MSTRSIYSSVFLALITNPTLDKRPSGFGKEELHVKVKYFKIPPEVVRTLIRVYIYIALYTVSYNCMKFSRIKFLWVLQNPRKF